MRAAEAGGWRAYGVVSVPTVIEATGRAGSIEFVR